MPSIETLLTFSIAAIILNLSPGPSNLYVMARSIGQGAKGGTIAALGLGRPNYTKEHNDTPQIRGMVNKVSHLVKVEEIKG